LAVSPEPASVPEACGAASQGAPDDPFLLLYTSGTTGRPKAACLTRAALAASADASQRLLGDAPSDCWLLCLPLHHVAGLSILVRSALSGACVEIQPRFDVEPVSRALTCGGVSHVSLVPTQLRRLLDAGLGPGPDLRVALLGGAAASPELLAEARGAGWPVAPTYGLTEAASQVATNPPGDVASGLAPLPGTRVAILGEADVPCGRDAVGEICVRGPMLTRGYWRRPEETARALRDGWLHTGDLGRLDAAGRLHVIERRADLIVSGGENVYPAEVERVLLAHPAVAEAGVAGVPDPELGARPCAWLVARGDEPSDSALRQHCRERLAAYKIPARFRIVESLPRTATGKLQRARLRELGSVEADAAQRETGSR
jgi:O-succinylbenzoic acid--CoA ligase